MLYKERNTQAKKKPAKRSKPVMHNNARTWRKMDLSKLNSHYTVRKISESDLSKVYTLCKGNSQAEHFWGKNGFEAVEEVGAEGKNPVIVMQKLLEASDSSMENMKIPKLHLR